MHVARLVTHQKKSVAHWGVVSVHLRYVDACLLGSLVDMAWANSGYYGNRFVIAEGDGQGVVKYRGIVGLCIISYQTLRLYIHTRIVC